MCTCCNTRVQGFVNRPRATVQRGVVAVGAIGNRNTTCGRSTASRLCDGKSRVRRTWLNRASNHIAVGTSATSGIICPTDIRGVGGNSGWAIRRTSCTCDKRPLIGICTRASGQCGTSVPLIQGRIARTSIVGRGRGCARDDGRGEWRAARKGCTRYRTAVGDARLRRETEVCSELAFGRWGITR